MTISMVTLGAAFFIMFLVGSLSAWFCYVLHIRPALLLLWKNLRRLFGQNQ